MLTKRKNGVTALIALIMILMMAVVLSTVLFYWLTRIQNQQQGTAGQAQERLFDTLASCLSVPTIDYNTLDNQSNVIIQNCGNTKIDFGDTRIPDNAILSITGENPCNININNTMCIGCPVTLQPGEVATLTFNWTAVPNCASLVVKGVKHQISFFVDRRVTASRAFIPDDVLKCGVSITNNSNLSSGVIGGNVNACFNLTVFNTGNALDVFTINNSTIAGDASCGTPKVGQRGGTSVLTTTCNKNTAAAGVAVTNITISPKSSTIIYVNQTAGDVATTTCNATITLASTNCASKSTSVITQVQAA